MKGVSNCDQNLFVMCITWVLVIWNHSLAKLVSDKSQQETRGGLNAVYSVSLLSGSAAVVTLTMCPQVSQSSCNLDHTKHCTAA